MEQNASMERIRRSELQPASYQFVDQVVEQVLSQGHGALSQAPILLVCGFLGLDPPPVVTQDSQTQIDMRTALMGSTCPSLLLQGSQRRLSNRALVSRAALFGSTEASLLLRETPQRLQNRGQLLAAIRQFDSSDLLPRLELPRLVMTCDDGEFVCVVNAELEEWLDGAPR